jgi:hypothetical protein
VQVRVDETGCEGGAAQVDDLVAHRQRGSGDGAVPDREDAASGHRHAVERGRQRLRDAQAGVGEEPGGSIGLGGHDGLRIRGRVRATIQPV